MKLPARTLVLSALLLLSASFVLSQTQDGKQKATASVTGKITIKGKPAAGIVVVMSVSNGELTSRILKDMTDEDGVYHINNIPSGRYEIRPMAPALVNTDPNRAGKQTLVISEGDNADGIDFELVRGGVITGKITLSDGQPLIAEQVNLFPAEVPRQSGETDLSGAMTDDRGVYRIFGIRPGKYKVSVGNPDSANYRGRNQLPRTYYPDVTDAAKATILNVDESSETANVDIKLGPPLQVFSISGRVIDSDTEAPVTNVWVELTRIEMPEANRINRIGVGAGPDPRTNNKGEFRVTGIRPGKYELSVYGGAGSSYVVSQGPVQFEVLDTDVTGLVVKTKTTATISGVLVFEGVRKEEVAALTAHMSVYVYIRNESGGTESADSVTEKPDGSFVAGGLTAGTAYFSVQPWNQTRGITVLRVERDGVVQPNGIKIQNQEQISGVRVVVTINSGSISGLVKVVNGTLPSGGYITVHYRKSGEKNTGTTAADARGRFLIEGLAAGSYELQVFPSAPEFHGRPPMTQQLVTVTDGAVTEVVVALDLAPSPKPYQ